MLTALPASPQPLTTYVTQRDTFSISQEHLAAIFSYMDCSTVRPPRYDTLRTTFLQMQQQLPRVNGSASPVAGYPRRQPTKPSSPITRPTDDILPSADGEC